MRALHHPSSAAPVRFVCRPSRIDGTLNGQRRSVAGMRIAAFNVENLFERARALNGDEWLDEPGADPSRWSAGRAALDAYAKLNTILRKPVYDAADKGRPSSRS